MSLDSIHIATTDPDLIDRTTSATARLAWTGPAQFADTDFAEAVRNGADTGGRTMIWPVAIDYEVQYESALAGGIERPGLDPSVISDANVDAAVQTHWPADPPAGA